MPDEPPTQRPITPEQQERRKEIAGAATGIFAGLGCLGFGLIMIVVVLGLLLIGWLIGAFSGPAGGT